jgi:3-hydroxybutyrate dehydrogenase
MKLKNRSAIITGAASRIGKEIASLFALEGAKVAIADLKKEAADVAAKQVSQMAD